MEYFYAVVFLLLLAVITICVCLIERYLVVTCIVIFEKQVCIFMYVPFYEFQSVCVCFL